MKSVQKTRPVLRTIGAILIGLLILILSSELYMYVQGSSWSDTLPFIEKTTMHLAMLVLSILFVLVLSKGKLSNYGFLWNVDFPVIKIVAISLGFGLLASFISDLFPNQGNVTNSYSFIETILFIWILASLSEEVLSRGLIQGFLAPLKNIGFNVAQHRISLPVAVGALFFGVKHLGLLAMGANTFFVLNIVFFGIILGLIAGYQKEKTNSLVPAMIVHFCFNVGGSFFDWFNF